MKLLLIFILFSFPAFSRTKRTVCQAKEYKITIIEKINDFFATSFDVTKITIENIDLKLNVLELADAHYSYKGTGLKYSKNTATDQPFTLTINTVSYTHLTLPTTPYV